MFYNLERLPERIPDCPEPFLEAIASGDLLIFCHARVMWGGPTETSKNTDWLVRAFARVVSESTQRRSRLVLLEYGPNVAETRALIETLGIASSVTWVPVQPRRKLMWMLKRVDVVATEYYEIPRMIWGGTGWESIASGKPMIQGFNFGEGEFEAIFGHPPPPMLRVRGPEDVYHHLKRAVEHPAEMADIGARAAVWFERYNGLELARRWRDLLY